MVGDRWWFKPVVQVGWGPGLHSQEPAPPELLSASWTEAAGWGPRAGSLESKARAPVSGGPWLCPARPPALSGDSTRQVLPDSSER